MGVREDAIPFDYEPRTHPATNGTRIPGHFVINILRGAANADETFTHFLGLRSGRLAGSGRDKRNADEKKKQSKNHAVGPEYDAGRRLQETKKPLPGKQRFFEKRVVYALGGLRPKRKETTNITRNTRKIIFAKPAAVPAIPPKPSTAAISAMMRNVIAQEIMMFLLK